MPLIETGRDFPPGFTMRHNEPPDSISLFMV
jgi:hypothetical protein